MASNESVPPPPSALGQSVRERTASASSSGGTILLIDDNPEVARALALAFDCAGYTLDAAAAPEEAFSMLARRRYDAILLDLNFTRGETSGKEGFAVLARIVADDPAAAVVVITAHSGIRIAVAAMQAGALDFVMKPWRNAELIERVEAAIAKRRRPAVPIAAAPAADRGTGLHRLLGEHPSMAELRERIRRVAPTTAGVLVSGPSGAGRSLVAALLHEGSPHADTPAVVIDARTADAGDRVAHAAGTVVLRHPDRIDDIAQERLADRFPAAVRPIGIVDDANGVAPRLRARLGTIELAVPPLDRRGGDALLLARHFAREAAARHRRPVPPFTASAEARILATRWPDEVRGLQQAVERAVLLDDDGVLDAAALAPRLVQAVAEVAPSAAAPLDVSLEESERVMIEAALRHHRHNVSHAATALGLSRQALYRRMERYGL
ncbi:sigma-54-dependent transcriptional regulator [Sphingomonas sp. ac-8]|uniref:sigma-54-dependent transcriptional regulator n=1 Tax=Sphingomonas sp. ac-8 TaxID=3242977 RepID=UPI003A803759